MSYSSWWQPPTRNLREREIAWANSTFYAHDTFCSCGNFSLHLLCLVHSITRNSSAEAIATIIKSELTPKQPCLTSGDIQDTAAASPEPGENLGDVLENLRDGELEELFKEEPTTPEQKEDPEG